MRMVLWRVKWWFAKRRAQKLIDSINWEHPDFSEETKEER
jgi:hypothetical protein